MSNTLINYAMSNLAQGGCSERLLFTKLEEEFENEPNLPQKINETLSYLKHLDLINDERVAISIAQRYSNKGDQGIIHHLKQSGIDGCFIQSALKSIGPEYQRALKEALHLCLSCDELESEDLQFRIMRLLCSRSFSYPTLRQVMDALFYEPVGSNCYATKLKNKESFVINEPPYQWNI